jgi:hypothetical protein
MVWAVAVLTIAAALLGYAAESRAASLWELNFWLPGPRYEAVVPLCDEPGPLAKIQSRFGTKEYRFWNSDLQIVSFESVREVAFMPWASGTIPRRFCTGKVLVSDGKVRPIHYSIAEDTGIIGATWGVEWCVVGLDRNWAYNPSCKMARP